MKELSIPAGRDVRTVTIGGSGLVDVQIKFRCAEIFGAPSHDTTVLKHNRRMTGQRAEVTFTVARIVHPGQIRLAVCAYDRSRIRGIGHGFRGKTSIVLDHYAPCY